MRLLVAIALLLACGPAPAQMIKWQPPVEIATGGGTKGPWQQNESNFDYVDDPSVAWLPGGATAIVWVDHRNKDVLFQIIERDGSGRLRAPVNISRTPDVFSWLPRIVVSPRDPQQLFVLYQEIVFSGGAHGGEMFFSRSLDGGRTFTPPINLSRSKPGDGKGRLTKERWHNGSFDLAIARDGTLYAAWTEFDGPLWFTSSTDAGASFARPRQIAGSEDEPVRAPSLAVAPDGTVYLAWTYGESKSADIHVAIVSGDRPVTPVIAARTPTYSDAPKLAVDTHGTVHLVYAETRGGFFDRARIYYTHSRGNYGRARHDELSFVPPTAISPEGAAFPALEVDKLGRILVLWERTADEHGRSQGLGLALSRDGGAHFKTTDVVEHSRDPAGGFNGSQQGQLMNKLAFANDSVAIVNSSLDTGRGSRVWLLRGHLAR